MLILSRKAGQSFYIGDNIEILVFEITGDKVRIGINAPSMIPILRKEIRETKDENLEASKPISKEKLIDIKQFIKKTNF